MHSRTVSILCNRTHDLPFAAAFYHTSRSRARLQDSFVGIGQPRSSANGSTTWSSQHFWLIICGDSVTHPTRRSGSIQRWWWPRSRKLISPSPSSLRIAGWPLLQGHCSIPRGSWRITGLYHSLPEVSIRVSVRARDSFNDRSQAT